MAQGHPVSRLRRLRAIAAMLFFGGGTVFAATFVPIRDGELYGRADVVVHGIVVSSDVVAAERWPETVTVIRPLRVLKGHLDGSLVLHQAGGRLSDGFSYLLSGRPEYAVGEEVVIFAIARDEGDFQTAEFLLGKFGVERDEAVGSSQCPHCGAPRARRCSCFRGGWTPKRSRTSREKEPPPPCRAVPACLRDSPIPRVPAASCRVFSTISPMARRRPSR